MAKFLDVCPLCGRKYMNSDEPIAYRQWCSVACLFAPDPAPVPPTTVTPEMEGE